MFHQYTLVLKEGGRDELREYLRTRGIPSMIYYPIPLHMQKAYRSNRYADGDFPVSEHLARCVLSLPMHTELSEDDLKYITENVLAFFGEVPELKDNLHS